MMLTKEQREEWQRLQELAAGGEWPDREPCPYCGDIWCEWDCDTGAPVVQVYETLWGDVEVER